MTRKIAPIAAIDDWEKRIARQDAFWNCAVLDRPVVCMTAPKATPQRPWPAAKPWSSQREKWLDSDFVAECAAAGACNTDYFGDALPTACPNLGPDLFAALMGCELEFGETTSWSVPNLHDWSRADAVRFDDGGFYWKKLNELTRRLIEAGSGLFYTGHTDYHPGGDAVAAFRDPMQLNLDLLDAPVEVKKLLERVNATYFGVFDSCHAKLAAAGQATTCWAGIVSSRKWYVPSNDFSCMVSKAMFDEFFLPGIAAECRQLEASIYHLDGPGALQHLDSLLGIPELNAIQWVYGAGHGRATDWLHVYKRCQAAGKGIQLHAVLDELDTIMEHLRPEGVWLGVHGVKDRETAAAVLRKIAGWKSRRA